MNKLSELPPFYFAFGFDETHQTFAFHQDTRWQKRVESAAKRSCDLKGSRAARCVFSMWNLLCAYSPEEPLPPGGGGWGGARGCSQEGRLQWGGALVFGLNHRFC